VLPATLHGALVAVKKLNNQNVGADLLQELRRDVQEFHTMQVCFTKYLGLGGQRGGMGGWATTRYPGWCQRASGPEAGRRCSIIALWAGGGGVASSGMFAS